MANDKQTRFLLGSNTKQGFVSLFNELRDPIRGKRLYLIKGGPGSGKSSLMRRVLKVFEEENHSLEYIHCASDPGSLDAFIDHYLGIAMVDATSPHIMDPEYPGAYDIIINMADCWDDTTLIQHKNEIIHLSNSISTCHKMATSCISSAAALLDNNINTAQHYILKDTINEFVTKVIKELKGSRRGKVKKRLLSAVSVGETVFFSNTIEELSKTIYVITDIWGAASEILLSKLHQAASFEGLEHIVCYCSIRTPDKIDHIIFPSASISITTANKFHSLGDIKYQAVPDLMLPISELIKDQMTLHLNKANNLIATASGHIKQAKLLHDDLEAFYVKAMDFSKVDQIYKKIMKDI